MPTRVTVPLAGWQAAIERINAAPLPKPREAETKSTAGDGEA